MQNITKQKQRSTHSSGICSCAFVLLAMTGLGNIFGCSKSDMSSDGTANSLTATETSQGWKLLFDGSDLSGYQIFGIPTADLDRWKIEGETLSLSPRAEGSKSKADLVITSQPIGDFEFSFEWRMSEGGNGGIFYKVKGGTSYEKPWHTGLEMQLLDNAGHEEGLITTHRSGDLYDLIASKSDTSHPAGEWNHSRILVQGNQVEQWMNGSLAVSFEIGSSEWNSLVSNSKYAEWPEYAKIAKGHLILQDHGDQIWFKNLKIRELK
ncbi:MAG: DUF1080 domain-containing protein [Verrucomicrobia bacterium]|nr:DUF1080 domain-containing protein [Verrucomicrobiota bacterium]